MLNGRLVVVCLTILCVLLDDGWPILPSAARSARRQPLVLGRAHDLPGVLGACLVTSSAIPVIPVNTAISAD
jgi:hypothetical protein